MNTPTKRILLAVGMCALSGVAFIHCGSDNGSSIPTDNTGSAATDLGNFNLSCGGQSSGQQKQVPFQQQQQSGCKPQKFQFQQQQAVNYDIDLDCDAKRVLVKNKVGVDQKQQAIPIQSDGTVKGSLQYQQQVAGDGKGNQVCWVEYRVDFNGKAQCKGGVSQPQPGMTAAPTPTGTVTALPFPGPSATPIVTATATASPAPSSTDAGKDQLSLTTTVSFQPTSGDLLKQIGIEGPIVTPSGTPSATPSATSSPGATPSVSPSPSASPSATPSPTFSPSATPTPTGTPVVICVVDDPCPIVGSTDLSCGQ